ncbi:MAG: SBBP repeat-containing protein [Ignavibacteria bacterium]|nr:SBBP repeat-containing protein [Ignavibacteria bacterium]
MKKLFYSSAIVLLVLTGSLVSQVTLEWVSSYNGPANGLDFAFSTAVDGLGNVYVTGVSTGNGTGFDYATIKYNSSGVQQWAQRYNGPGNGDDYSYYIAVDGSGNVWVTGESYGGGTTRDYTTIKYNSSGDQQWIQTYNGPIGFGADVAHCLAVDNLGNAYVSGHSDRNPSVTDYDYTTIKYNSSGVQQWIAIYDGSASGGWDWARSIAVDGSGNVYVTGWSEGVGTGNDYATIKYNSSGIQQWAVRYNGPGNGDDSAHSIAVDISGNVYVTGGSFGIGTKDDYATVKYNSSGVQQWAARYNGSLDSSDAASLVKVDGSGNVYVTGGSVVNSTTIDYSTIKYNSSGVQQWVSKYNGPRNYIGRFGFSMLAIDSYGNSYAAAISRGSGVTIGYATIKYNASGVQQWVQTYYGPGDSAMAFSITVDGSSNVYLTGTSAGIGTGYDFTTIKYSQSIGIQIISTEIPSAFSLQQNYPNPFNPTTKIRFDVPIDSRLRGNDNVVLKIYDALGREVAVLVNENLKPGTYEADWNASSFPSGVYFYTLKTDGFTETKKMILIK